MENRGYFFIDGSHLFASIFELQRNFPKYKDKKIIMSILAEALMRKWSLNIGQMIRCVIYTKREEKRIGQLLDIGSIDIPGEKNHWRIIECGQSIQTIPESELQKIDVKYRDHFRRAEKGVDIKLTCDALMLASSGKASNFIFIVNDRDYLPLFESLQSLGANVYITALSSKLKIQKSLLDLTDKYLTLDEELDALFGISQQKQKAPEQTL